MTVGDHPMNRSSDKGPIKVVSSWMADYRAIIWPVVLAFAAMGFKFSFPNQRLDAVEAMQQVDHVNVQVLVRLQCFNPSFNDEQRAMAGLQECSQIRQGLPDPSIVKK